jgi:16S rRNA C967 or C1407 C5-methylase (RsmB/RsmF family)
MNDKIRDEFLKKIDKRLEDEDVRLRDNEVIVKDIAAELHAAEVERICERLEKEIHECRNVIALTKEIEKLIKEIRGEK